MQEVISALVEADPGARGLTTGLVGGGGFGKTTLAIEACHRSEVRRQFPGGIVWVTVGQDKDGPGLAALINDVIAEVGSGPSTFTNPEQAGHALVEALATRGQTLLVVDDVWTVQQLKPFIAPAGPCRLLVTTRRLTVLPEAATRRINVDQMTDKVAARLLTLELPPMALQWEQELLALTGRWPLLLSVVNRRLREEIDHRAPIDAAAAHAAGRLRQGGPAALDITDSGQRETAVAATVEYSLELLDGTGRDCFADLAIFREDAEIPVSVAALLWAARAGISESDAEALCDRLDGLSLLSLSWAGTTRVIVVHDVIRRFALSRITAERQTATHAALISAARRVLLPDKERDMGGGPARRGNEAEAGPRWWQLPDSSGYLWQNLTYHLHAAAFTAELEQMCGDLRWIAAKMQRLGPAAVEADLAYGKAPLTGRLRRLIAQNAHLLGPIEPPGALITTLTSRLAGIPGLAAQHDVVGRDLHSWTAWPAWAPPDQPAASLMRVFTGEADPVRAVAIAPDGTWLATGDDTGTARIWSADGTPRATLAGPTGRVNAVAISPDGTWLVTAGGDKAARIWSADGTLRATLTGHGGPACAVAIAPDGTWLATGDYVGTVRIWDASGALLATLDRQPYKAKVRAVAISPDGSWLATCLAHRSDMTARLWNIDGTPRATLIGHTDAVEAVAISRDGTWLATGSMDSTVRIWAADGTPRATLTGHGGWVEAVAISPDGTWLATGSTDATVRIWAADGTPRATLTGHGGAVEAVAISPDSTWLATGGGPRDAKIRIWASDGTEQAGVTDHADPANTVAISPDGTWLASIIGDRLDITPAKRTVRIWAADGAPRATLTGHGGWVEAVAISPDSTWLATAAKDTTVRIWAADGTPRATLTGHTGAVEAVAISPDSTWLATGSTDRTVRIWASDGTPRATLTGHTGGVNAVAISPDGTWLATGGFGYPDNSVRVWAADGTWHATLTSHTASIRALAISPDSTWLATTSDDYTGRIWDRAGTLRTALTGHTDRVDALAISSDGTWLATGGNDKTVRIWASETGACLTAIRIDGAVYDCAWYPAGNDLCIAGERGLYKFSIQPPGRRADHSWEPRQPI